MTSLMLLAAFVLGAAAPDLKVADIRWADGDTLLALCREQGMDSNRVLTLHVDEAGISVQHQFAVPSSAQAILADPSASLFALSDFEGGVSVFDGEKQLPINLASIGAQETLWRSSATFASHLFPVRGTLFVSNMQALGLRLPGQNFLSLKITDTCTLLDVRTGTTLPLEWDALATPHYHHHGPAFGPSGNYFVLSDPYSEVSSFSVYTFTPFERVPTFNGAGRPLDFLVSEDMSMKVLLRCGEKRTVQRMSVAGQDVMLENLSDPGHLLEREHQRFALNDVGVWRLDHAMDTLHLLSNDGVIIRSLPARPEVRELAVAPDGEHAVLWSVTGELQLINTDPAGASYATSLPEMEASFSSGQQGE